MYAKLIEPEKFPPHKFKFEIVAVLCVQGKGKGMVGLLVFGMFTFLAVWVV